MKVLHIYAGNLYGGIERMLATVAEYRRVEPRVSHEFALCFHGRLWNELEAVGASPHDLGEVRLRNPFSVYLARRRLARLLRDQAYDVAITHACWPHIIFSPVVKKNRTLLINWVHDALKGEHRIERTAAKTPPEFVIANSQFTAQTIPLVFPHVPYEMIYYPIAKPAIQPAGSREAVRASLGALVTTTVILQVSRMEAWKGHKVLLTALATIPGDKDWVLWIAGGAQRPAEVEYESELKSMVSEWKLADRVRFLGQRSDIPAVMAAADIFCQPNANPEPFGIVFVEALYAGLPAITSNFGGAAEIIDDSCGMLVPANDPPMLAQSITTLLDSELRDSFSQSGSARAKLLCDPVVQLRKIADTLERVFESHVS